MKLLKKDCMLENFDYGQVPAQFAHCFRAECRRSGECLRYQIGTCVPKERQSVLVVNPARIAQSGADCFDGRLRPFHAMCFIASCVGNDPIAE